MSIGIENTVSLQVFSDIYTGGTPDRSVSRYWEHGTVPWINSGSVNQGTILDPSALITVEAFERSSTSWARKEDLVIALAGQGRTKGMVAQMGIDACVNQSMAVIKIRPESAFVSRFVFYAVDCQYRKIRFMAGGDKRDGINLTHVGAIRIPFFPMETQHRIADYLDRETAEIDAAVADLDKYVELLKKREEILVEELLCKSEFPKVPLFTFCHLSSGDGIDKGDLEHSGRFPVYGGNGVMGYSDRSNRNQDTLVVGRVGALCGNVHYAKAPFFVTDNALVLSLKSDVSLDWLQFALRNLRLRDLSQSSAQPVITATTVLRQRVSLPPAPRQLQIASRLGEETAEIKALIAESTKLRDLLLQRRSVLITEVVTGRKQV